MSEYVTDEEIDKVWGNASFGDCSKRHVVNEAVLKVASGYYQGSTSRGIVEELKLKRTNLNELTEMGKKYLWEQFHDRILNL
jgi:hypothetical protein